MFAQIGQILTYFMPVLDTISNTLKPITITNLFIFREAQWLLISLCHLWVKQMCNICEQYNPEYYKTLSWAGARGLGFNWTQSHITDGNWNTSTSMNFNPVATMFSLFSLTQHFFSEWSYLYCLKHMQRAGEQTVWRTASNTPIPYKNLFSLQNPINYTLMTAWLQ